jgi:hypothetical protein
MLRSAILCRQREFGVKSITIVFCIIGVIVFLAALDLVLKAPRVSQCISTVAVPCPADQR